MRVRRHFAAQPVGLAHNHLHLFQRILRCLRIVTLGEHATRSHELDHVRAVLDVLAHLALHPLDSVGRSIRVRVELPRQQVLVCVPAGNAQWRPAHQHARTRHITIINGIAQRHIGESARSHIAHRGKSCHQRVARVLSSNQRLPRLAHSQLLISKARVHSQVHVAINKPGQHGGVRQINQSPSRSCLGAQLCT